MELQLGKTTQNGQKTQKIFILIGLSLVCLTIIPLYHPSYRHPSVVKHPSDLSPPYHAEEERESITITVDQDCDIFTGEWIPNPEGPYYRNDTCWAIHEHLNCMKYGRPDSEFMQWRWKPDGCDLPIFNPYQFLDIVKNKSLAFVGDAVGRNQMQSLICLLSRVEYPYDESYTTDQLFKRWRYREHNFTLAIFTSSFLVKASEQNPNGLFNVYLDEFDEKWTTEIENYDYVIVNSGQWFNHPSIYYENNRIVGCHFCQLDNIIDLPMTYGYRKAFQTAFKAINSLKNFKGVTFLRTFVPSHFEGGEWNKGGNCVRTRPFRSNETKLEDFHLDLYLTQVEEFKVAQKEGRQKGTRFRLFDTTQAMLLRPDGHPGRYGHALNENIEFNDCVYWCLPGPIDTWSDFMLHMMKMEGINAHEERLQFQNGRNLEK